MTTTASPKLTTASSESVEHVNGDRPQTPNGASLENGERQAKKPRLASPPWKKVAAEGPTSFMEEGRRRSGRVNTIPLDMQKSDKRITRRALQGQTSPADAPITLKRPISASSNSPSKLATYGKASRKLLGNEITVTPLSKKPKTATTPQSAPTRISTRVRRVSQHVRDEIETSPKAASRHVSSKTPHRSKIQKIILRNRAWVPLTDIPLLHPGQTVAPRRIGTSFETYFDEAANVPVEQGGQYASEDGPAYTVEMARRDASIIARIEHESEPGGFLTDRCSLYVPEPAAEPPRQYAHKDHMVKAVLGFRRLVHQEQTRHRQTAKKMAEACREVWLKKQPKSAEDVEREARQMWLARYKHVLKALIGTWENIQQVVVKKRLEKLEVEEQKRIRDALQKAVAQSELQLLARQGQADSEGEDDDELDTDVDMSEASDLRSRSGSDTGESSEEMSSEDEDDEKASVASDEGLTAEQLREKYAELPNLEVPVEDGPDHRANKAEEAEDADESRTYPSELENASTDESTDMDDDLGSTDLDDSDDESDGGEASSEEEDEDDPRAGLLGFLDTAEVEKLEQSEAAGDDTKASMDIEMADAEDTTTQLAATGIPTPAESVTSEGIDRSTGPAADSAVIKVEIREAAEDAEDAEDAEAEEVESADQPSTAATGNDATPKSHSDMDLADTNQTTPSRNVSSEPPAAKVEVPFLLRGTLREYQHAGLDWLANLYANNTNGILADEMGLGKTIQTIALLAHLACHHEVWGPHLIIVPTSVVLNWEMEFKKWCPGFKILTYYGSQEERKRKRQGWTNDDIWNVCITSYTVVLQDQQVFKRRRWHYMVLDEAHNIKNFRSQRWQTLLGFNTHSRLLLTGTPLQNNLAELWSLLFFLTPPSVTGEGGFADLSEFNEWFSKPESQILEHGREHLDDQSRETIAKLHGILRPYLLRRLKKDVEKQMPAKYEHVEFCLLSKRQRELYDGFLGRTDTRSTLAGTNYLSIMNCLMQLRKVCNHPDLFVDRPIMTSFNMNRSVVSGFELNEHIVRNKLLRQDPWTTVSLGSMNLIPTLFENTSGSDAQEADRLTAYRHLTQLKDAQQYRGQVAQRSLDPSTVQSNIAHLERGARWSRYEELRHCAYLNAYRRQSRPLLGKSLHDLLSLDLQRRPFRPRPRVPGHIMSWFEDESLVVKKMVLSLGQRAEAMHTIVSKFACVTPAVITRELDQFMLGSRGVEAFEELDMQLSAPVKRLPFVPKEAPRDPWHEARMRLSIQFPDRRLLQYDCGKLQTLDKLLRKLRDRGSRALIFTQMTKVLDILEQFLNIHGHIYLRLDGATKIEQRQIMCDRFNNDNRILAFILSTRSGGLGLNLTGADTVIFYDQDWNPAMDKQCQDRCHRIGQTRDVHIYRLVSEHTIEANILRKASQKQMLDDVVIQEGEFNTNRFNDLSVRDAIGSDAAGNARGIMSEHDDVANAAMDRILGGVETTDQRNVGKVLGEVEDAEDKAAAKAAEKEIQEDEADFSEKTGAAVGSGANSAKQASTPKDEPATPAAVEKVDIFKEVSNQIDHKPGDSIMEMEHNAWGEEMRNIDDYMLTQMEFLLKDVKVELPKDKKRGKKGRDHRKR